MKPILPRHTGVGWAPDLFERTPIGMGVTSIKDNALIRVNAALCRFLGYSRQELLGKTVHDITYPADRAESSRKIRLMRSGGPSIRRFEKRYLHKNGKVVWGDVSVFVVSDRSGTPRFGAFQILDITRRKHAEEALRLSNDRFRVALDGSPATVYSLDRNLRFTWVYNPKPGFKAEDMLGKRDSDIFNADDAKRFTRIKKEVMKTGVKRRDEVVTHLPNGTLTHDMSTEPLRDERGKIIGVICAAIDITERKRLEGELKKANEQLEQKVKARTVRLRQLVEELTIAEHRERRRIADILHSQLQQHLCGMKFGLSELKEISSGPAAISRVDRLMDDLDKAIHETRALSAALCPQVLSHLGLKACIEWLASNAMSNLGLDVKVRVGSRVTLACTEMQMFVFDAIRELLLNVVKHAKVKTAEVRVSPMPKGLVRIEVKDAGAGFDKNRNNGTSSHFGLFRIQERAESFGGRFEVASQPNKGTCVSIILPVRREAGTVTVAP